jgi:hypothetical protein
MMKKSILIAALLAPVALVQGQVIVNDTFADGERLTQDLMNNSMAWYSSSGTSTVIDPTPADPGPLVDELTQLTGTSGRALLAFFTDTTEGVPNPENLAAGETLLVRFVIRYNGDVIFDPSRNDFRVGVYDSGGVRANVMKDDHKGTNSTSNANADFVNYTGYAFTGGIGPARNIGLREKFAPSDGILIASTSVYTALGSTSNTGHTEVIPGDDYTGRLMITNTGSSSVITYSLDSGLTNFAILTRTDSDAPYTSFDTVCYIVGSNVVDGYTLKAVEVSKVSAPSTPAISGEITGPNFVVTCPSEVGVLYQLIVSDTELSENDFSATAVENKVGTGSDLTFTVTGTPPAGEKRFYKVIATVNP